jgi:hypothetical protein
MSPTITANSLDATVPALSDPANIVTALTNYHTDISDGVAVLARANTFTAPITMSAATQLLFNDATTTEGRFLASSGVMYIQAGSSSGDTSAELRITRNTSSTTNISALKLYADNTTLYGALNLVAGTTSIAPIIMTSGTNLTTPVAGAFEYDGSVMYATPKVNNTTAGRGLLPAQNILRLNSNNTQSVSSSGSTITTDFYAFNKSIYLAGSQAYFVDMSIRVYHNLTYTGSGSGSITFLLKGPTSTSYEIDTQNQIDMATLATAGTPTFEFLSGLGVSKAIKTSLASSDSGYSIFRWSGIIYTGSAGNFGPAFTLSATGTGTTYTTQMIVQSGSYCKITPLGATGAEINIGGWA